MSKAHIPLPTINVRHKELDTLLVINEGDFNAEIHERIKAERPRLPDAPAAPATGDALKKELDALTIPQLREHALYAKVADPAQYSRKADLLKAMLAAA